MENIPKLLLVLFLAAAACQDKPDSKAIAEEQNEKSLDTRAAERDAQFVVNEVSAHRAIVDWAIPELKVNEQRELRDIAFKLQREHTRLLDLWKEYAKKKNILVPDSSVASVKEAVSKHTLQPNDSVRQKSWVNEMLDQERKLLTRLEDYMDEAGDPALKVLLQEELPVIRINRDQLMMLKSKL
jgi:predicted outer membrane protein